MIKPFPRKLTVPLIIILGVATGLTLYLLYISRAHTYLSEEPSACVNCHIMAPYYQSWQKSSHGMWTTCNDCHVPQDNIIRGYAFKAMDGLYHAAVFTFKAEPLAIRPRSASYTAIMENCIRCHTQLNTEFIKSGMLTYSQVKKGEGLACWDCHREVTHGLMSSIAMSPNAIVPLPASPLPQWLKKIKKK